MQDKPIPPHIPDAPTREWIAQALVKLTDLEEHESGPFVNRMIALGPESKYDSNDIAMAMSYLSYAGLISYRTIQRNGFRLAIKRSADNEDTRKFLIDEPPLVGTNGKKFTPAASASESTIKVDKKKTKKKKKKGKDKLEAASPKVDKPKKKKKKGKKKAEAPPVSAPKVDKPKKKKKKKCCDDPRIVRSKKTGERRCKNCGAKYKAKKKKEE